MFALPETKRVRRTKLFKSSSPPPPSTPNGALHLDFDFITVAPTANPQPAQPPSSEDLDFQLFSTAQKITLKDPTPPPSAEDAWELQAQLQARPATYYVLTEDDMATRRRELQFVEVVVSAEEIMRGAKIGWPGCRVPWKVTTIKVAAEPQLKGPGKCVKPGKKRRVYLRKKEQKRREVEEARLKAIEGRKKFAGLPKDEREAREREERNKRNREKKIKRRIREKAKKAAARAAGGGANEDGGSGSGDDSESENENGNENEKMNE